MLRVAACLAALAVIHCAGTPGGSPPPPGAGPRLTSLLPAGSYNGAGGFPMEVNGSGFVAGSTVQWNGSARATTFVNSTRLLAQVLSADLATSGTATVTVVNAPSSTSNALAFVIAPRPAPGTGVVQLITVATDGTPTNGNSFTPPGLSADGRYVVFPSDGTTLVPGPASGFSDIYVRDTCLGAPAGCTPTTIRASVATDGTLANGNSRTPSISADGRFVAFDTSATNLVPNDTNGFADVLVRDTCIGAPAGCTSATMRVSIATDGTQGDFGSRDAVISANGRFVVFSSGATNLVPGDTNGRLDIFVRDTCFGAPAGCTPTTTRVSVATDGTETAGGTDSLLPFISPDGRFVTFLSFATNLVPGDTNGQEDIFVRDTCLGAPAGCTPTTTRASVAADGTQANARADNQRYSPITPDGRFVAFSSFASNLVAGDTNGRFDIFVRDTCVAGPLGCLTTTRRVSIPVDESQADNGSGNPSITPDGRLVVFDSIASNLIPSGSSGKDVFLRDTCVNGPPGCFPTTILLSITPDRLGGNGISDFPVISADGRFVVFRSTSTNLVPGGTNGNLHVFLARTGFN